MTAFAFLSARRFRGALAVLLAAGVSATALSAGPRSAVAAPDGTSPPPTVDRHAGAVLNVVAAQVTPVPTAAERTAHTLVESLLKARPDGRRPTAPTPLSRREAALLALKNSRTLAIARNNPGRLDALLREVQAVYDPVFDLSLGYTRPDTYKRSKEGTIWRKAFTAFAETAGEYRPIKNPLNDGPQVAAVKFLNQVPKEDTETITASPSRENGHLKDYVTYSIGLAQVLPWGGQLTLTDKTTQQQVYYRRDNYWTSGQFSTDLTARLNTPLPGTKGFGADNPANSLIRRTEVQRQQIDWELAAEVNSLLYQVDQAFFDLARQMEALRATVANRDMVKIQRDRMARQFALELVTRYQKAVVDAEYARATMRVETAILAYLNASNTLSGLIGDPAAGYGGPIYAPYAYGGDLLAAAGLDRDALLTSARQNRADFHVRSLGRDIARIDEKAAENQAKPDVRFSADINLDQNGSIYGYRDPFYSHTQLGNPDTSTRTASLAYTYPLGNRAAKARAESARLGVEDSELAFQTVEAQVRQEIAERLSGLQTAQARTAAAQAQADQLRIAYDSRQRRLNLENEAAWSQMNAGAPQGAPQGEIPAADAAGQPEDMGFDLNALQAEDPNAGGGPTGGPTKIPAQPEDELIAISRNLLNAELALATARIDARKAQSGLLAAQGILAGQIPVETATSELERRRLALLSSSHPMTFLGTGTVVAARQNGRKPTATP